MEIFEAKCLRLQSTLAQEFGVAYAMAIGVALLIASERATPADANEYGTRSLGLITQIAQNIRKDRV
jgi:hypothetical protein